MNESFIGASPINEKIKLLGYFVKEIQNCNLFILMQIENASKLKASKLDFLFILFNKLIIYLIISFKKALGLFGFLQV